MRGRSKVSAGFLLYDDTTDIRILRRMEDWSNVPAAQSWPETEVS